MKKNEGSFTHCSEFLTQNPVDLYHVIWLLSMNCLNWDLSARFFSNFSFMTISFLTEIFLLTVGRSNFLFFLLLFVISVKCDKAYV